MPTVPLQSYVRLTHLGVLANGKPNTESVFINDMDVGYEFQARKAPVYVPVNGYIDVPLTSRVLYSLMQGTIAQFSKLGMIGVSAFSYSRDGDNLGGSGTGVNLNAGVANNVEKLNSVLRFVIDAGLNTSGMLVGERLNVTGLTGNYSQQNGAYTITNFTKGQDFTGLNAFASIVSVTKTGGNIAQELQGPGVLLTLPDGMITHLYVSSGNAGGLGSDVRTYFAGDVVITGVVDPIAIQFSATDLSIHGPNSLGVDTTTGLLAFKAESGDVVPLVPDWQPAILSFIADNTQPPLTEFEGDRYILSSDGGTPHIDWDGALAGDTVQFTSGTWVATSPSLGMSVTLLSGEAYTFTANGWTPIASVRSHNALAGLQGGISTERYHLTETQHDSLTDGSSNVLHTHPGVLVPLSVNGNPNVLETSASAGTFCLDTNTSIGYINTDGTTGGWQPLSSRAILGSFTNDAGATAYVRANKWDTTADGLGDPLPGMFYYNTTSNTYKTYSGGWTGNLSLHSASHQHGGSDEIATVTPTANAIPKANAEGFLDRNWFLRCPTQINVCADGDSDFTSVKEALDSILDAGGDKPYVISVHPGVYIESPFTLKPYVTILGLGAYNSVVLQTNDPSVHFITGVAGSSIQNIVFDGPTNVGTAAIFYADVFDEIEVTELPFYVIRCVIRTAYYGVWADVPSADPIGSVRIYNLENYDNGTTIENLIRITGYSQVDVQNLAIRSNQNVTPAVTRGIYIQGPNTKLILQVWLFNDPLCTDVIFINDGATVRISSLTVNECINAIHMGSTDSSLAELSSVVIHGETSIKHVWVESPTSTIQFEGVADKTKIVIQAGATASMQFADATPGEEGIVNYGELWLGTPDSTIPMRDYGLSTFSTGYLSGGNLSRNANLDIDVSSGSGFINSGSSVKRLNWGSDTITLAANAWEWIYVDMGGNIQHSNSEPSFLTNILLGTSQTDATDVIVLHEHQFHVSQAIATVNDYLNDAVGPLIHFGGLVSVNSAPSLKLDVASGEYFVALDKIVFAGATPATFTYWYRKLGGGWNFITGQTDIDPSQWDDGSGTLQPLTLTKHKKDLLFVVVNDTATEYHVFYGQEEFDTQNEAELGNNPAVLDLMNEYTGRLAGIVTISGGAGGILSITDARTILGQGSGGVTAFAISNHAELTHLDFSSSGHTGFQGTAEKGAALGYASLDAGSKVVQDPTNATATPTASKIPIADGSGKLDGWVSNATNLTKGKVQLSDDPSTNLVIESI